MRNPSSKTKLLAFDFDGVLANSSEQMLEALISVTKKMGIKVPELHELRTLDVRALLKKMGVGKLRAWWMVRQCQKYLSKQKAPPIVEGMKELLMEIKGSYVLGIVSTSPKKRIQEFLEREGLSAHFDFLNAPVSLWGKDRALWDISLKYKHLKLFYMGDEERDTICGHTAGYQIISVGWGAKDGSLLKTYRPEYFVDNFKSLTSLLKGFD